MSRTSPPALASGLNAIYEAALRARRIVQNLLTFARPKMRERMIFLTGDLVDPRTRAFLDRIQRPVIEKPFQVEDLVRVLREHLG